MTEENVLIKENNREIITQRLSESYNKLGTAFSFLENEDSSIKKEMRDIQKRLKKLIDELQN